MLVKLYCFAFFFFLLFSGDEDCFLKAVVAD